MTSTTIDVIIPTYNGLPWLKHAVESVLAQTHKDLILYIVDDGSTDKTSDFVKSLKDTRVTYIKKKNGGHSSARNLGIEKSSSLFVALLDADDIWYPTKLEKQLELINKDSSIGMVYGHHYIIDEDDIIQGNLRRWKRGDIFDDLCNGNIISGSASMVLIRRKVLEEVGLFKTELVNGEDWELWLRIASASKIDFVPEIVAAIRQHSKSFQVDTKRMADGLVQTYGVIAGGLDLTKVQQIHVASYCYLNAIDTYRSLGERGLARQAAFGFIRENPRIIIELEHWLPHLAPGIYAKAFFGNPVFDLIGATYNSIIALLSGILSVLFRVLLYPVRAARGM